MSWTVGALATLAGAALGLVISALAYGAVDSVYRRHVKRRPGDCPECGRRMAP